MRMEDLSAEQQKLLKTDFGADIEKVASAQAKLAKEMYANGQQIALNIADQMDKEAAEKVASEAVELPDAESEKRAAEMGRFIERGQFDGLRKLGSERHGNEWHYIYPFVEEKVASSAAKAGLNKFRSFMASKGKAVADKAKGAVEKGKDAMKKNPGKAMAGAGAAGAAAGFAAGRSSK